MKRPYKNSLLFLFFLLLVNTLYAQDYYKLSEQYFKDTKTNHINFLKKAFQENNAKQLLIDYQNLELEHKKDIEDTNKELYDLQESFKAKYTHPDSDYDCQKFQYYKKQLENLDKRISTLKSMVNMAKTAYEYCSSNCADKRNNYNNQISYYNKAVGEWDDLESNYNYYRKGCLETEDTYNNAINYYKTKEDNILATQQSRIDGRSRKFKVFEEQILEVILNTPMYNVEYYDNGNKSKEGYLDLKTNKYVGAFKKYYSNGNLEMECTLKNGQPDGHYTEYYETGIKKAEVDYKDGAVVGSWKNYNEEGVDEQAEMTKEILGHWKEESAANNKYYEAIDNSSVAESITANPIRTIKEDNIELVIDFSKASKETVNFFLVRPDNEKSKELRQKYINDILETDGGKVSCNYFGDDGQIKLKTVYDGLTVTVNDYNEDGSYSQSQFQYRNKIGMLKEYDKNGNRIASEEREADINTFLKQKNFYTPATLSYGKNIEISDGIWEVVYGGSDQDTYQYSYKQLNDTQIELTLIQSNDSSNKYKKGDKFIVELLFMNIKSKFYKLTITPLDTSYRGSLEEYYYN